MSARNGAPSGGPPPEPLHLERLEAVEARGFCGECAARLVDREGRPFPGRETVPGLRFMGPPSPEPPREALRFCDRECRGFFARALEANEAWDVTITEEGDNDA